MLSCLFFSCSLYQIYKGPKSQSSYILPVSYNTIIIFHPKKLTLEKMWGNIRFRQVMQYQGMYIMFVAEHAAFKHVLLH